MYQPFESFQHQIERANGRLALYYRLRVREAVNGEGFEHSLSFVRSDETEVVGKDEAVSVTMTCTNRERAAQLKVGDICVPTNATPNFFTFRNITRPTRSLRPVLDGSLQWMLISSMSLNYVSLLSPDALTQVLRTWNFPALYDKQAEQASRKRLEGIERIETVPVDRTVRYGWLGQHLFTSLDELQNYATQWQWFYNHERPNMALNGFTPMQHIQHMT